MKARGASYGFPSTDSLGIPVVIPAEAFLDLLVALSVLPFIVYTALAVITSGMREFPPWWSDPFNPHPSLDDDAEAASEALEEDSPDEEDGSLSGSDDDVSAPEDSQDDESVPMEASHDQSEPSEDDS